MPGVGVDVDVKVDPLSIVYVSFGLIITTMIIVMLVRIAR